MSATTANAVSEVVRRGLQIYEEQIRPHIETPENIGKVVVIDVDTGEYEFVRKHLVASDRLKTRLPGSRRFATRISYPALNKRGCAWPTPTQAGSDAA